jgi:site-specific DNA recombinase
MNGQQDKTSETRIGGRAVVYLRVSSRGQVDTDYDPEGNSIPAQRKACMQLAERMGLTVVDEYVEPGKSARSIDGRPAFRKMMGRIRNQHDVDFVVVYMRSRLFRDATDAGLTKRELRGLGVAILSVKDPTDDSPTGDLMAHMVDGFNEYQSRVSGQDIAYKMEAKAARGGTPGRAPLGYSNIREMIEGREIRTVALDPERASLIKMLFERYATGQYSFQQLRELAANAGLRSRPTRKHPAGSAVSIHKIGQILVDRYYLGTVTFNGTEYPGRHEPLIEQDLFDKVQAVLFEQRGAGSRERKWNHYLKGLVWCARCKRRLIIERGKSKTGRLYFYFLCMGRNDNGACDLPRFAVADVESAVAAHYATIALGPDEVARTRAGLERVAATDERTAQSLRRNLKRERARLDALEDQILELLGHPDWPTEKLTAKIRDITSQRAAIDAQLAETGRPRLDQAAELIAPFLEMLADPRRLYESLVEDDRQTLNAICFTRLHVDTDADQRATIAQSATTGSIAPLLDHRDRGRKNGTCPKAGAVNDLSKGQGSSTDPVVELRGFEPLTFSMPWKRATNCAKAP